MQSTESSLTVLIMSRLYCIFFSAYMLKVCVLILILAAREIKSTAAGEKKVMKGIYFKTKLQHQQDLILCVCVCVTISRSPPLIHSAETSEVKHLQCLNNRSGCQV